MANRQQRRAAAKKRPGENYADVLARKKMIKAAVERTARDESVALEADVRTQRFLWMAVIALNECFGFGGERARRFLLALEKVANEVEQLAQENGSVYAVEKLCQRCQQITGMEVRPVHEEDMLRARRENEAQGIFFPAEDPEELARIGMGGTKQ